MAISRDRLSKRQKTCMVLSAFLILFGLLQVFLGVLFSIKYKNRKCHRVKYILIGVYLLLAGIFGVVGYCPRRSKNPCKSGAKRVRGGRACITTFVIFCALVTIVVVLDNNVFNCIAHSDLHSSEASARIYAILSFVEVTGLHLAHILCALCVGLATPDLLFPHVPGATSKYEKNSSTSAKYKPSKQPLHLPEARTHVQEAPGTGDKVTVVSLPESEGIVYAVPEEQYVIRRGEATYMAPPGNTNLTSFFPTYTKVEAE